MKPAKLLLKIGVVCSSILLAGGLIAYRAGAFTWIKGTSTPPGAAASNPTGEDPDKAELLPVTVDPTMFYSSKSISPVISPATPGSPAAQPVPTPQPPPPAPQPKQTILPGSKSYFPGEILKGVTPAGDLQPDLSPAPDPSKKH